MQLDGGHHSYVKRGRGEKHEICSRFAKSRGPSIKFGHAKLVRGKKSVQISPPRANDPSHPCTCRYKLIAAVFNVNTAHFTFGDQTHTYYHERVVVIYRPYCTVNVV